MSNLPSRTDIVTAMRNPIASYKTPDLVGGNILYKGSRVIQYSGGYTTVFPFLCKNKSKVAIRCWIADIGDAKKRTQTIAQHLSKINIEYFVKFNYIEDGILVNGVSQPIVIMDWVEGNTLKDFINLNINNSHILLEIAEKFKNMVRCFHQNNISHGDLQHGNIMVKSDNSLLVIDYDSMYVDGLESMPDVIKGLPGYQHPARMMNSNLNNKLDYFSELIIYLSLLVFANKPNLWNSYFETEDLLFSKTDFDSPETSKLFNDLKNSPNTKISNLTIRLLDFLKLGNIELLSPLEESLICDLDIAKGNIFEKWEQQPNPPEIKKSTLPSKSDIIDKF